MKDDSLLKEMIKIINEKGVNSLIKRQELIKLPVVGAESSVDTTRRMMIIAGYLSEYDRGVYKIDKIIPLDLTLSQLRLRSYPHSNVLNKSKSNLRPEWKGWYFSLKFGI